MLNIDKLIIGFDSALRTLLAPANTLRPVPGKDLPENELSEIEKRESAALMRINHVGEVCAQALYQGQALTARNDRVRQALDQAAREETEHLAWTERRIAELGGRKSFLNPLWYGGSFTLGLVAGVLGDKWNLGFLAETERQVEAHLGEHMDRLPPADARSRAILATMQADEARHADNALARGGAKLPFPIPTLMRGASAVMKAVAYRL